MIRKARVEAEAKKASEAPEAAEFISFDFSDEEVDHNHALDGNVQKDPVIFNAPTAPRSTLQTSALPSTLPTRPPEISVLQGPAQQQSYTPQASQNHASSSPHLPATLTTSTKQKPPVDLSASTNLGSRKRTADDKIKERPHQRLQRGKKMKADATVEISWQAIGEEEACPWVLHDHSSEPKMGVRYVDIHGIFLAFPKLLLTRVGYTRSL
jgi:hypothetical protein